jgi:DNA-binding transcriptional MerR regulator
VAELRIGEVARRAGVAASTLRYYEAEGLLPRAPRSGGHRVYPESILQRLALIALAKEAGFTVAEIRRLLSGFSRRTPPGQRWRKLAESKAAELDRRIEEARRMKAVLQAVGRCECPTLDDCGKELVGSSAPRA